MANMTLRTALRQGCKILEDAAVPEPKLTAEVLLLHALKRERSFLYSHPEHILTDTERVHYGRYLLERGNGRPTQQITRRQEFYGRDFLITPDVLIPRPETEHLVEEALKRLKPGDTLIDVGCGTGAIGISVALEMRGACRVFLSDISTAALAVASENARRLGAPVSVFAGDLATALAPCSLDMLVSNPPYIPEAEVPTLQREVRDWEPHIALVGGATGTEPYVHLVEQARRVLRPGGWVAFEIGYRAEEELRKLLGPPWRDLSVTHDLAGWPRVVAARWNGGGQGYRYDGV